MRRKEASKVKSMRKPLRDLPNNYNGVGGRSSKSEILKKKTAGKERENEDEDLFGRLLLVRSDLSSFLRQIDELMAKGFKVNERSKLGRKEVESFTHDLSEILSSLKPWVPRFEKMLSGSPSVESKGQIQESFENENASFEYEPFEVKSPEKTQLGTLISPSPLVSWRAGCNFEERRQLFLLTPLHISKSLSSKFQGTSIPVSDLDFPPFLNNAKDGRNDLLEGVMVKSKPSKPSDSVAASEKQHEMKDVGESSPVFSRSEADRPMLIMTPSLKMSPPKSCVLLEPISEKSSRRWNGKLRKATPFPVGVRTCSDLSVSSESEDSKDLRLRYPELLGIKHNYRSVIGEKELEASPKWLFSPPKSCVLLEPTDQKLPNNVSMDTLLSAASCGLGQGNAIKDAHHQTQTRNPEHIGKNNTLLLIESTPMWKEPTSTIQRNKRAGESTLKRELWIRFEAASTDSVSHDSLLTQKSSRKGFLDMLDEVSCDEDTPWSDGLR